MCEAVAVCSSMVPGCGGVDDGDDQAAGDERAPGLLAGFRRELYRCFTMRADALLELADAVLCRQDRVHICLLYTSPSPRDRTRSRMPSSA